MDHEFSERGPY